MAKKRPDLGRFNLGNAKDWAAEAKRRGFPVDGRACTRDAVVFRPGQHFADATYGHVAYVEGAAKGRIRITEMNTRGLGVQSERFLPAAGLRYIHKKNKSNCKKKKKDRDKDGVPDAVDKCPTVKGPAAADGCPDEDKDKTGDKFDLCPTTAGTADGCPAGAGHRARGDFDGDGFDDLAVGAPGQNIGSKTDAGAVNVIYGSAGGLNPNESVAYDQDNGLAGGAEAGDSLGSTVVSGDFDNDGFDDLAVGVVGEDINSTSNAGAVNVIFGSATGLNTSRSVIHNQGGGGLSGNDEAGDSVGSALAAGDFDGDLRDDLAVGAPGENIGTTDNAGAVNVIFGGATGLDSSRSVIYNQGGGGLSGNDEAGDKVGSSVAAGNFDGDTRDDLAAGAPGENIGAVVNSGAVNVIFGGATGLDTSRSVIYNQGGGGLSGNDEANDHVGSALGAGDFDGDSRADLAIGVPGEDVITPSSASNAGAVNVLFGSATGLNTGRSFVFSQGDGLSGTPVLGDVVGASVVAGDYDNDNRDDLAVGAPGENIGSNRDAGLVDVIFGGATGLDTSRSTAYSQGNGLSGTAEDGDFVGGGLIPGLAF